MRGRDFLRLSDVSSSELHRLLDRASELKTAHAADTPHRLLEGRSLAMLFEKSSLRTRTTFVLGMAQLGGTAIDLMSEHTQIGVREPIPDIGRNLERWVDGLMARVFKHTVLNELAEAAAIPIINGLSDLEHPCQTLADLLTIREKRGELEGCHIAYIGDGFNVCNSLLFGSALTGMHIHVATPSGYEPNEEIVKSAERLAQSNGSTVELGNDPVGAARNADVVYTDAWVSMGLESEAQDRQKVFDKYRVNASLMAHAKPEAIFMHCLPAHRGDEVSDEVIDGKQSVVFDQAENRLHTQKALLVLLFRGESAFAEIPT